MPLRSPAGRRAASFAALAIASIASIVSAAPVTGKARGAGFGRALVDEPARPAEDAGDAGVQATLACERAPAPGRVRCEVEIRASSGTLAWGDVIVTSAAPSLTPLRARIGAPEATMSTASLWRFTLAVAAKQRGTARLEAKVRLVHCQGDRCEPRTFPIQADVVIAP